MTVLPVRQIEIGGAQWSIQGPPECSYFRNLPDSFAEFSALGDILGRNGVAPAQVIDVGANIGLFTLWAGQTYPQARLLAIEPNPSVHQSLVANLAPLAGRADTVHAAVGEASGSDLFRPGGPMNPSRTAGAHFVSAGETPAASDVTVKLITLDSVARPPCGTVLVKVDVEGFELEVLRGGADLIGRASTVVFMEFNAWCLVGLRRTNPHDLLDHVMKTFGFVYVVRPGEPLRLIRSKQDVLLFLHDHLISHGCVDDLLLTHSEMT